MLVLLTGVGLLLYPKGSDLVYQHEVQAMERDFVASDSAGSENGEEAIVPYPELWQACVAYNTALDREGQVLDFARAVLDPESYGLEEGIFGYVSIPRLGQVLPITLGATTENLDRGAVHLGGTSLPIGSRAGESVNTVLAAHRGYNASRAMWRDIQKLETGALVLVTNHWEQQIYQVAETRIIDPGAVENVTLVSGQDLLTLATCHPLHQNTQRYLVICQRLDSESED